MESRVSNMKTKFDEFQTSQDKFRNEFKTTQDLILLQLQLLMAKYSCESSAATPVHQPFIKMTSPISLVKSNQVVLKLQSFHEEKIRAREQVDQFFSQFRQRYKRKSHPGLQPKLKKFKKVRNKYHDDKQRKASVPILGFQSLLPATRPLLDSACILGSALLVSNVQKSNFTDHGYKMVNSVNERFKSSGFSLSDGIVIDFLVYFNVGFILDIKQMLIPEQMLAFAWATTCSTNCCTQQIIVLLSSKSKNKDCVLGSEYSKVVNCEVGFDHSMIIDGEYSGNLGLHHLEACMNKNRKNERKFTLSRFETGDLET